MWDRLSGGVLSAVLLLVLTSCSFEASNGAVHRSELEVYVPKGFTQT